MREILGPVVRHLWAWHKVTIPVVVIVLVVLCSTHRLLWLGFQLLALGWLFTDMNGHAAIHHPVEWTSARWVRWVAQVIAVAGAATMILWAVR